MSFVAVGIGVGGTVTVLTEYGTAELHGCGYGRVHGSGHPLLSGSFQPSHPRH